MRNLAETIAQGVVVALGVAALLVAFLLVVRHVSPEHDATLDATSQITIDEPSRLADSTTITVDTCTAVEYAPRITGPHAGEAMRQLRAQIVPQRAVVKIPREVDGSLSRTAAGFGWDSDCGEVYILRARVNDLVVAEIKLEVE